MLRRMDSPTLVRSKGGALEGRPLRMKENISLEIQMLAIFSCVRLKAQGWVALCSGSLDPPAWPPARGGGGGPLIRKAPPWVAC